MTRQMMRSFSCVCSLSQYCCPRLCKRNTPATGANRISPNSRRAPPRAWPFAATASSCRRRNSTPSPIPIWPTFGSCGWIRTGSFLPRAVRMPKYFASTMPARHTGIRILRTGRAGHRVRFQGQLVCGHFAGRQGLQSNAGWPEKRLLRPENEIYLGARHGLARFPVCCHRRQRRSLRSHTRRQRASCSIKATSAMHARSPSTRKATC